MNMDYNKMIVDAAREPITSDQANARRIGAEHDRPAWSVAADIDDARWRLMLESLNDE
jgi:hypothetical protein